MNEREKYEEVWKHEEYRAVSPAETVLDYFTGILPYIGDPAHYPRRALSVGLLPPHQSAADRHVPPSIIDFGCGTGRATLALADMGFPVLGVDIADNALDEAVRGRFPFLCAPLTQNLSAFLEADYGLCVDVLEHLPISELDDAVAAIASCVTRLAFIRVANFPESHGDQFCGEQLHLSLMDSDAWEAALSRRFAWVKRIWLEEDAAPERYTFVCMPHKYD